MFAERSHQSPFTSNSICRPSAALVNSTVDLEESTTRGISGCLSRPVWSGKGKGAHAWVLLKIWKLNVVAVGYSPKFRKYKCRILASHVVFAGRKPLQPSLVEIQNTSHLREKCPLTTKISLPSGASA